MGKLLFSILFTIISFSTYAQRADIGDDVYSVVDVMPEYPGGKDGLIKHLMTVEYPTEARKNKWEGTAYIQFIIDVDGSVTNISVARTSGYEILDEAAMSVVASMAKWTPGKLNDEAVKIQYVIPLKFAL